MSKVADILDTLGKVADVLSGESGVLGKAARGASALTRAAARAIRERGMTVDEIIAGIEAPPDLKMPWPSQVNRSGDVGETARETPSAKKRGK